MSDDYRLLPCPFCGSAAQFRDWGRGDKGAGCSNLCCIVSVFRTVSVQDWNRRVPADALRDELAELADSLVRVEYQPVRDSLRALIAKHYPQEQGS